MAKKKSFTEYSPAMQFISGEEPEPQAEPQAKPQELPATQEAEIPPEGYKLNPLFVEVKSKRVQLVLQPSLLEECKAAAKREGISLNEFAHRALRSYLKGE